MKESRAQVLFFPVLFFTTFKNLTSLNLVCQKKKTFQFYFKNVLKKTSLLFGDLEIK